MNMHEFNTPATQHDLEQVIESLTNAGIKVLVADTKADAKDKVLSLIPEGSEVMTYTSVTLDEIGITKEINESGNYDAVRPKLYSAEPQSRTKAQLGAAPVYALGSVHAITTEGQVVVASNSGSQLAAYVSGAEKVIWVVGTQKIVSNLDEAMKRIQEYTLPLESERARKAYGVDGSYVSKLFILNREVKPGRITVVFISENIGF